MSFFKKAKCIWANDFINELNCSLFFKLTIKETTEYHLKIAANNFYRIYVNGVFKFYGPSRGTHNQFRIDEYDFKVNKDDVLVIEVSGYNCNSFYALNTEPFLCFELFKDNKIIDCSNINTRCYKNFARLRKVSRFSYQRAFSESYEIDVNFNDFLKKDKTELFPLLDVIELNDKTFIDRIVDYPTYKIEDSTLIESGNVNYDKTIKPYDDRYQVLEYLKIFNKNAYEINANDVASSFKFIKKALTNDLKVNENEFITFDFKNSLTGFINLKVEVKEDSLIYIIFDEVDLKESNDDLVDIRFYRNTTHNIVTYSLKKGIYNLVSFEPYTIHFLRLICLNGSIKINKLQLIKYENPNLLIKYDFKDIRINSIFRSAVSTFAQNAVDILTDCPSRERAGWLCDSFFSGQAETYISGNNKVEEAFLMNYSECNKDNLPKGMIPMCYPGDFPEGTFIPNWSLWYILELKNYFDKYHDDNLLKKSKNNILGILEYFKNFENSEGLLENLEGWVFVEWSKANDDEFIKGVNYPSNMLYSEALRCASNLLNDFSLLVKSKKIKETILKDSFNGEFFIDNSVRDSKGSLVKTNHTSETCQYYAIYFDIANYEENKDFIDKMLNNFGEYRDDKKVFPEVYKSNVLMGIMMRLSILNRFHYYDQTYKESIEYFYKMAKLTGTLWEHDSIFASLNHAFTSYIINLLVEANFGVKNISYKDKIIYLDNRCLKNEGFIKIPIGNKYLKISYENKQLTINCPRDFKIVWN